MRARAARNLKRYLLGSVGLEGKLRNRLQYLYSISVFFGVLVTAYLMMNNEGNAVLPARSVQAPTYRSEATIVDPAVNQLFEMEDALSKLPGEKAEDARTPTEEKLR